jgi:hypothetical protein
MATLSFSTIGDFNNKYFPTASKNIEKDMFIDLDKYIKIINEKYGSEISKIIAKKK